ncbi:hypothetical protein Dda_7063 [Drechslerella dactyloides]|uniref:Uncharacterized protein n=1 Tax=Drechslerella dactyloides TaxID=74499 RepID=A0AAD6NG03_DREDA|nr:hypothetical protein Dda_7063 [Drechslerella dactyloides]
MPNGIGLTRALLDILPRDQEIWSAILEKGSGISVTITPSITIIQIPLDGHFNSRFIINPLIHPGLKEYIVLLAYPNKLTVYYFREMSMDIV